MIKNLPIRINADNRGHISSGVNVGSVDRPLPKSIEGFNISKFAELEAVYGKDPKALYIVFPVNDLHSVFDCEYGVWGKGPSGPSKKRVCDGEECTHRITETHCGQRFEAGEVSPCACINLPPDHKEHCEFSSVMRAMILHPETREFVSPNVYTFRNKSKNSAESIYAELSKTQWLTHSMCGEAKLVGIPFELSVQMVSSKERANQKFPIWNMRALMFDMPLLTAGDRAALTQGTRPQLPSGDEVADKLTNGTAPTNGNGHKVEPSPPPSSTMVRTAEELRAAAQAFTKDDAGIQADDQSRRAAIASLATLTKAGLPTDWTSKQKTARSEVRAHALIYWLFSLASRSEMSEKECQFLREWISVSKDNNDNWMPSARAVSEANVIYTHVYNNERATFDALTLQFEPKEKSPEELEAEKERLQAEFAEASKEDAPAGIQEDSEKSLNELFGKDAPKPEVDEKVLA